MKSKLFKIIPTTTLHISLNEKDTYELSTNLSKSKEYAYKITHDGKYIGMATIVNEFNEYIHVLKLNNSKNKVELYRFYFIEDESKIFKNCLKTTLPNKVYIGPRGGKYILKTDRKIYV